MVPQDIAALYSDKDYARDLCKTVLRVSWKTIKYFGTSLLIGLGSAFLVLNGFGQINNRLTGVSSALTSTATAFETYRKLNAEKIGEEAEKELYYGVHKEVITEEEKSVDENGNEIVNKVEKEVYVENEGQKGPSVYSFFFDKTFDEYCPNPTQREYLAKAFEKCLNDELVNGRDGAINWITLSKIYDIFGRDKKDYPAESLILGIPYDPNNPDFDNCVNLNIERVYVRNEDGTYEIKTRIDPNISGRSIYEMLPSMLGYKKDEL